MKALSLTLATSEQLPIVRHFRPGIVLIRGAAGSGKTTTALLRLRQLTEFWATRAERETLDEPVRVLVLTFNRTLRGYIQNLADHQIVNRPGVILKVSTFAKWAHDLVPDFQILEEAIRKQALAQLCEPLPLPNETLIDEADYAIGRFLPIHKAVEELETLASQGFIDLVVEGSSRIPGISRKPDRSKRFVLLGFSKSEFFNCLIHMNDYLDCRREGRGALPRFDRNMRQRIISEVITPYNQWKAQSGVHDWNDYAVELARQKQPAEYQVIIADETQDFSANQIRAIMNHAAEPSSVTFVLDSIQRIYPRGFTWREAGVIIRSADSFRLKVNQRNTQEICCFAYPLVYGIEIGDDGTLPDFKSCQRHGPTPKLLVGKFSNQTHYSIQEIIMPGIDLSSETVGFLHPLGGGWFDYLESELGRAGLGYVKITRQSEWPDGPENIALSTMASAKGLEFDHVFILGLNDQVTPHDPQPEDSKAQELRRLLAMAITRARKTVTVGYKPEEASQLIKYFLPGTFEEIRV